MTSARPSEITFTPGMAVGDSTALAWMQQVTLLPRKGDGVWFEFEGGDVNLPIWTGF